MLIFFQRFFSMMRYFCGTSNDHPDSILFIQMYKLIATYSLIKPPKGANVSGGEMVEALLKFKDITDDKERWSQWQKQLDKIVDTGRHTDNIEILVNHFQDHDYKDCTTSDFALAYIAGYVSRKSARFVHYKTKNGQGTCENCMASLNFDEKSPTPDCYEVIKIRTKGFLAEPSIQLFNLINALEKATLSALKKNDIITNTIFNVTDEIERLSPLPFVGCEKHSQELVHRIITFYITM